MPEMKARVVLAILAFSLFFVAQMNRVNINIAIITMEEAYIGHWQWNAKVILLGAYYWCYSLIELPGTFFLRKYGCRKILAINMFLSGVGNFVFPALYKYDPVYGIIIRALQGLLLGITWPAIAVMSAKWIPRQERSKFTSTYQGSSVGTSFTNALGGIIIFNWGWPYVFYGTGILSIIWVVAWAYCAYDSPAEHPRISEAERKYIEKEIGETHNQPVPWKQMLYSKPFWGVFIGTFGIMWFVITTAMQLPAYLHDVHQVNIRTNGLLLCIPDIFNYIFSFTFSVIIDKQIRNESMSITNARKFSFIFSHIIPATLMIFLSVYGNNLSVAMVLIVIAVASSGATSSGNLANIVDISPRNAGIIMGICKSLCLIPGVLSPIIVRHFTFYDVHNWFPIFAITSVILVSTSSIYFAFGSGEIQDWDKRNETEIEMEIENGTLIEDSLKSKLNEDVQCGDVNCTESNNLINENPVPKINAEIGARS